MCTVSMFGPGHLPEAGFRRHAPRQRKRRRWWRWRGGAMWRLRTEVSSLGTYISLIGQSSTSASFSPSTRSSRTVTTSCAMCEGMQPRVNPNADFSLLSATMLSTLTRLIACTLSACMHYNVEKGINKRSTSQNKLGVQITPSASGVATTLTSCATQYTPESDIKPCLLQDTQRSADALGNASCY